ncbi:hypothetical protein GCK72_012527 [Caenorhabditis remanei]|uniref:SCP domain-containing protein n=1 Tax=Caenorhabditis remanei TaxID=31234 RepID=A0A6A5GN43_CAERE|nr:hypothetical protein GCK72_012527 [Caenorhabditis remanei]KAF1756074.1 hypothetical protein GCK72_012527 [Caenorhabditis remanei]
MKIHLCIGVFLILFVGLNSSLSSETEEILDSVNNFRKTFADLTGVKGMSKLKYDRNLQLKASRYSTCDKPDDLKNQSTYFPSDQSVIDEFFEVFNQTKSDEIKKKFGFDNVLNPGFTHIGCYHYKKQCSETVMYSTEYFTKMRVVDTKGVCLLSIGPYCPHGSVENGMCKMKELATKSQSSSSKKHTFSFSVIVLVFSCLV